jgi:hypothetical protein
MEDSLDEIAPEFRVSPSFASFARAFDKEFSLCANYAKGWGEIFGQWMGEEHAGELLFQVERAMSGTRMDVVSMAALAIFWNRNYCVEFLNEMQVFCDRDENILAQNMWHLLTSTEMIATARLWSIFHISIIMPIRWLASKTHEFGEYNSWGYISMGRVLDTLKEALEAISDDPSLIANETFMMGIFDEYKFELPPFNKYVTDLYESKTSNLFNSAAKTVPLRELRRELFHPRDEDNQLSTSMLVELAPVATQRWIKELTDASKGTFRFLSESKGELSWDHASEEDKMALVSMFAVNDLAESSFAGVSAQVQVFGRIGLANAAAVSDMKRNGFLYRPTPAAEVEANASRGLFFNIAEELRITAVLTAIKWAPATRNVENQRLSLQRLRKREKDKITKEKNMEGATGEYIDCLIFHRMGRSEAYWEKAADVKKGVKALKYKYQKEEALKDNIQMRFKGEFC